MKMRRLTSSPAAVTFLLAPAIGEFVSTSSPLPGFLLAWLPLALLYGCGALLVRELALRWRSGWLGIGLLGAAYGIVEEGLVVRSFFDPAWEDLGKLAVYGRDGGVNWLWATQLTVYHAVVSIGVTLAIVEMLFPDRRRDPWLGRRGFVWCGVGVAAWIVAGFGFYHPPAGLLAAAALAVVALTLAARRAGGRTGRDSDTGRGVVPRPRRFVAVGAAGWVGAMFVPYLFAEFPAIPPQVAWLVMVAVVGWVLRTVLRWAAAGWDDRHRLGLIFGLVGPFVVFGPVFAGPVWGTVGSLASGWAAWRLWRRVNAELVTGLPAQGS